MNIDKKNILQTLQIRHTECREAVLDIFETKNQAFSHADIEAGLTDKFDRVTVYRTLKTFVEKGVIHKVLDDVGGMKYAFCKDDCHTPAHIHQHNHIHFKCNICGLTTCLDQVSIPTIVLPIGYKKQEMNLLVQGICSFCSNN
jgi:Fur family transcriptional regulator, ferric uptake regulator